MQNFRGPKCSSLGFGQDLRIPKNRISLGSHDLLFFLGVGMSDSLNATTHAARALHIRMMGGMVLYGQRNIPVERVSQIDRGYMRLFAHLVHVGRWPVEELQGASCHCSRPQQPGYATERAQVLPTRALCKCSTKYLQRDVRAYGYSALGSALALMCPRPSHKGIGHKIASSLGPAHPERANGASCVSGVVIFHFDMWLNPARWVRNSHLDLSRGWMPLSGGERREDARESGLLNVSMVDGCHWMRRPSGPNGTAAFIDHRGQPAVTTVETHPHGRPLNMHTNALLRARDSMLRMCNPVDHAWNPAMPSSVCERLLRTEGQVFFGCIGWNDLLYVPASWLAGFAALADFIGGHLHVVGDVGGPTIMQLLALKHAIPTSTMHAISTMHAAAAGVHAVAGSTRPADGANRTSAAAVAGRVRLRAPLQGGMRIVHPGHGIETETEPMFVRCAGCCCCNIEPSSSGLAAVDCAHRLNLGDRRVREVLNQSLDETWVRLSEGETD